MHQKLNVACRTIFECCNKSLENIITTYYITLIFFSWKFLYRYIKEKKEKRNSPFKSYSLRGIVSTALQRNVNLSDFFLSSNQRWNVLEIMRCRVAKLYLHYVKLASFHQIHLMFFNQNCSGLRVEYFLFQVLLILWYCISSTWKKKNIAVEWHSVGQIKWPWGNRCS